MSTKGDGGGGGCFGSVSLQQYFSHMGTVGGLSMKGLFSVGIDKTFPMAGLELATPCLEVGSA